ncbi:MAG: hypothetical protein IKC36_01555 [Clostridia bacterium]|nr:hypothetical protein [Clostridia bacterium]
MYCRKCGKQIDYDSEFCIDCKAEEAVKAIRLEVSAGKPFAEFQSEPVNEPVNEPAKPEPDSYRLTEQRIESREIAAQPLPKQKAVNPPKNPARYGLVKGILSSSFGAIATALALWAIIILIKVVATLDPNLPTVMDEAFVSVYGKFAFATIFAIPAAIFGILSIVSYKKCVRNGWGKPKLTLILGICGLASCAPFVALFLL